MGRILIRNSLWDELREQAELPKLAPSLPAKVPRGHTHSV